MGVDVGVGVGVGVVPRLKQRLQFTCLADNVQKLRWDKENIEGRQLFNCCCSTFYTSN